MSTEREETFVAGVRLTHPGRVLYPEQGVTKADLAAYFEKVAHHVLPGVEGRPLSVVRCPGGREAQCFYQKHLTESLPDAVDGVEVEERDGRATYIVVHDLKGLVSLVQFGALELHPWNAREDRLDRPDRLVFDLDPAPEMGWQAVKEAAGHLRRRLAELGLESFLRTSGGKGLHLVVPLVRRSGWEEAKAFARGVAEELVAEAPERYVATPSKEKRRGRIFIDYLRNARGATAVASYSTRARPGAPVATPLGWGELDGLERSDAYTVASIPRRLASLRADPWRGFDGLRQSLTRGMLQEVGAGKG